MISFVRSVTEIQLSQEVCDTVAPVFQGFEAIQC